MEPEPDRWLGSPKREYRTVPAPEPMRWDTSWPIPAPEVVRSALERPLRGLWIDHVPTGAEIATIKLRCRRDPSSAWTNPLVTGHWESYGYAWADGHPELMSPQMVMPDIWFDHDAGRGPPPALKGYEPKHGRTVGTVIGLGLSGSGHKEEAEVLPRLWRRGLLRSAEERSLANHLLKNASMMLWYQIMLDEGWSVQRGAQVLREAGIRRGDICQLTNRWAKAPPGTPSAGSSPPEEAWALRARCERQLAGDGAWPLDRSEEIARSRGFQRVA